MLRPNARARWWAAVALVACAILVMSVAPMPDVGTNVASLDKLWHVLIYGVFAWIWFHAIASAGGRRTRALLLAGVAAASYGLFCEAIQACVPYRSAEWFDVLANSVGAVLGSSAGWIKLCA